MNKKNVPFGPLKAVVTGSIIAIAGLSMMVGTTKPAMAGSSFSLSISTNDFTIGYRSYSGGGYRYWTPGCFDEHHHWHDGYYSGPVVYDIDRDDGYHGDRDRHYDYDSYRFNDHNDYRSYDNRDRDGGWNGHDSDGNHGRDGGGWGGHDSDGYRGHDGGGWVNHGSDDSRGRDGGGDHDH